MATAELTRAAELLRGAGEIVVLTGAGLSAPSGLPTYRGAGGMWEDVALLEAHDVAALPGSVPLLWSVWGPLRATCRDARPNAGHFALSLLGRVLPASVTLVTQNVDGLQQRAGDPSTTVNEIHGSLFHSICLDCGNAYRDDWTPSPGGPAVPVSPCCGGVARPGVVLFGEPLAAEPERRARSACRTADVLLVVGTSGAVTSATGLVRYASDYGAECVLINAEPWAVLSSRPFAVTVLGPAEELLPELVDLVA